MSQTVITYNSKLIFQSEEDERKVVDLLKSERDVFNFCSEKFFKIAQSGEHYSIVNMHKLCYKSFRKHNKDVPAQIVIRGTKSCLAAYRSIKSNKHKILCPPKKKRLSTQLDKRLYSIKGNSVRLTTIDGPRIQFSFEVYPQIEKYLNLYPLCDPKIFVKDSQIWIALGFKIPYLEYKESEADSAIGVDLGKRRTAAISDGRIIQDKKYNKRKRKTRYFKRTLQSIGTKSARRHLSKVRHKEANQSKNQSHLIANEILKTDANIVVLEDLSNVKKKKNKYQNKNSISQVPFFRLKMMLKYKAQILGKRVETVSPYNTSIKDSRTNIKSERKGCRLYCKDGAVLDSDVNAAINIVKKSKHPYSSVNPIDGSFKPIGQAAVNRPTVFKSNRWVGITNPSI